MTRARYWIQGCEAGGVGPEAQSAQGHGATVLRVWAIVAGVVTPRGGHERAYGIRLLRTVHRGSAPPILWGAFASVGTDTGW